MTWRVTQCGVVEGAWRAVAMWCPDFPDGRSPDRFYSGHGATAAQAWAVALANAAGDPDFPQPPGSFVPGLDRPAYGEAVAALVARPEFQRAYEVVQVGVDLLLAMGIADGEIGLRGGRLVLRGAKPAPPPLADAADGPESRR